ncbi:VWA domain-containing protein [soil metagenome]
MRRSLRLAIVTAPLLAAACGGGSYSRNAESVGSLPASPSSMAYVADGDVAASTEQFTDYGVNGLTDASKDHLSTFAIDVDTASYSITRRYILQQGSPPPPSAVRVEEFINSFGYDYVRPTATPFAVYSSGAPSPFAKGHSIIRVALQGKSIAPQERKPVHLVYLVDTSGSMSAADKIELAKKSLRLLTDTLHQGDTVALCTYAGSVSLVLPPTGIDDKAKILKGIDNLMAGGSTAMASGIELAYSLASKTHVPGDVSRVIVLSDGDANVGNTSHEDILKTIVKYKEQGITLSTVGFGSGNYKDTMMEQLADKGDGNYSYIDSETEARRVFGESVDGLLQVIARDVKVQVDFDPKVVKEYRLIGYENRDVADKDFKNDRVDGGEVGAGHSVTALYDVVLQANAAGATGSPLTVHVRAKPPLGGDKATESEFPMDPKSMVKSFDEAPASFRFVTAVVGFGEILRKSPYAHDFGFAQIQTIAEGAIEGKADRIAFLDLVRRAGGGAPQTPLAR